MAIKNVRKAEQNIKLAGATEDASGPSLFHEHPDCRTNLCKALQCMRKRHLDLSLVKGRLAQCKQAEHRSPLRHPGSASTTDPSEKQQQHRLYHGYRPSLSLKGKKMSQKYRLVLAQRGGKTRGAAFAHPGRTAPRRTDTRGAPPAWPGAGG